MTLPKGIDERDLIPDPAGRQGYWLHPQSDQVISLGRTWRPSKGRFSEAEGSETAEETEELPDGTKRPSLDTMKTKLARMNKGQMLAFAQEAGFAFTSEVDTKLKMTSALLSHLGYPEDLTGKRVEIVQGRYDGRRGQVSDMIEPEEEGGKYSVEVILDKSGETLPFEADFVRVLTAEEIQADEVALKAEQDAKAGQ